MHSKTKKYFLQDQGEQKLEERGGEGMHYNAFLAFVIYFFP